MRIKSLLMYQAEKNALKEYSFSQGDLGYSSTYVFGHNSKIEVLNLLTALKKIFTSQPLPVGEQIIINLEDDTHCSWRIKKTEQKTEYFREGESISEEQVQKSLLAAMLDLDIKYHHQSLSNQTPQLSCFLIKGCHNHYVYKNFEEDLPSSPVNTQLENHLLKLQLTAGQLINAENKSLDELLSMAEVVEEISHAEEYAHAFEKSMISALPIPPDQQLSATRILTELQLISNIEQLVKHLEERKEEIKSLKQRLTTINMDLDQFQNNNFISHIYKDTPWREILVKYAELLATTELIEAFTAIERSYFHHIERAIHGLSENFQDADAAIAHTLETFNSETDVLNDYKIFKEKALAELEGATSDEQNAAFNKAIKALKAMVPAPSKSRAIHRRLQIDEDIFRTKEIWSRIEKCSNQLNSLQLYLRENSELGQVYLQPIKEHLENLIAKAGTLKQDWQEIRSSFFAEDLSYESVEDVLNHLRRITSIVELECEKKQLQLEMSEFQNVANKLVKLIRDWRDLTRSMRKETPKELSLIIAEAKSITRFKHEKENLLEKLNEYSSQAKLPELVIKQFDQLKKTIQQKWQGFLKKYALPEMSYDPQKLVPFLAICRQLAASRSVLKESLGLDIFYEPLKNEEKAAPILVFLNLEEQVNPNGHGFLKNFLLTQEPNHIQILMMLSSENSRHFGQMGFGTVKVSEKTLKATESFKSVMSTSQNKAIANKRNLSQKAEEALRVFSRKNI